MATLNNVIIDGKNIAHTGDFHQVFKAALDLSDSYGENFDALYDVLTSISRPLEITVRHERQLRTHLGEPTVRTMKRVFQLAAERNNVVSIVW